MFSNKKKVNKYRILILSMIKVSVDKKTHVVYNVEVLEKQVFTLLARNTDQHSVMKRVNGFFSFQFLF